MTKKVYMENSYLTTLRAKVLSNEKINGEYHLLLDKTIFYPDGVGGQPGDIGSINGIDVEKSVIDKKTEDIYHILKEDVGDSDVTVKIDPDNRFKIMQNHSAQHLISACFMKLFKAQTLSVHIDIDSIYIDIETDELNEKMIESVEDVANTLIFFDFPIKSYFPKEDEIKNIKFRRTPTVHKNLRVVEIENFDIAACGGTHVASTGEIGIIKILNYIKYKKGFRIQLVAGFNALSDYRKKLDALQFINQKLAANDDNVIEKYEKRENAFEELNIEYSNLKEKIISIYGENLKNKIKNYKNFNLLISNFDILPFKNVHKFSTEFDEIENLVQIFYTRENNELKFLLKAPENIPINFESIKTYLKKFNDFKGGGSNGMMQGSMTLNTEIDANEYFENLVLNISFKKI